MMELDVGCGNAPKGDINIDLERKPNVSNFVRCDAHNLPFRDSCFDAVSSSHVIEHLENPLQALREMNRVMIKGGVVEIYTPSVFDLDTSKGHLFAWNMNTLRNLLLLVFSYAETEYTPRLTIMHGRLGKYVGLVNLLLSKLNLKRELRARAW